MVFVDRDAMHIGTKSPTIQGSHLQSHRGSDPTTFYTAVMGDGKKEATKRSFTLAPIFPAVHSMFIFSQQRMHLYSLGEKEEG